MGKNKIADSLVRRGVLVLGIIVLSSISLIGQNTKQEEKRYQKSSEKRLTTNYLHSTTIDINNTPNNTGNSGFPSEKEVTNKLRIVDSLMKLTTTSQPKVSGPEQDCNGAIAVCQQTYTQPNSYQGYGSVQEVYNTCLLMQERQTVWYVFTVQTPGTFTFMLNTLNDYDWALYDISTIGCSGVPSATPVRCNYSATYGNTGMQLPVSGTIPLSYDASSAAMMPGLNVTTGTTYALVIDNFTQDLNGYTLTFGGTATIFDNTPPSLVSVNDNCHQDYITLTISEGIQCGSIASNGSDFTISGPGSPAIISATGVGCPGNGLTNQVRIYYSGLLTGTYTIGVQNGSDGNTLLDKCGGAMSTSQVISFTHLGDIIASANSYSICSGQTAILTGSGGPASGGTYTWSPSTGLSSTTTNPTNATTNISTTYTVSVTYGGCTKTDTVRVAVITSPIVSISPMNPTICAGTVDLTATAIVNGLPCTDCNYSWNGGAYNQNGVPSSVWTNRPAGTYTVVASTPTGCAGNTATSIVSSVASPPSPTCNVVYASVSGGGTGLTASSPTTLANAITMTQCSNAIIKIQQGTYYITNKLQIYSFITLEGGYDASYLNKSSQAGATTIVRTAANVEGLPDAGSNSCV